MWKVIYFTRVLIVGNTLPNEYFFHNHKNDHKNKNHNEIFNGAVRY